MLKKSKKPKSFNVTQNTVLWFGKYKGRKVKDIIVIDPSYMTWCMNNIKNIKFNREIKSRIAKTMSYIKPPQPEWDDDFDAFDCFFPFESPGFNL